MHKGMISIESRARVGIQQVGGCCRDWWWRMVCVLWDDDQFVWISRVLYSRWKPARKVIVGDPSSDHSVLCLRQEVSGVEDDCAYNYDNEEQSAENENRLAGTEIHVLIPLRSFGKITLGVTSRRRWRI